MVRKHQHANVSIAKTARLAFPEEIYIHVTFEINSVLKTLPVLKDHPCCSTLLKLLKCYLEGICDRGGQLAAGLIE